MLSYADAEPGTELEPKQYSATRLDLVKYAGASGDFNVIHWNERLARSVGLPDVIAHGMFTMAQAGRYVTELAGGDPAAVLEFGVRFSSSRTTTRARRSRSAAPSPRNSTVTGWRSTLPPGPAAPRC
jgi:acyl dehydratase